MEKIQNQIKYNKEIIPYELQRAKIKNLYIYIKEGKVIVKAPMKLQEKQIIEFINKKAKWILKNIKKDKEKNNQEEKINEEDIIRLEQIVKNSIDKYSKQLKVIPNKIRIKNIKYAWGSCSSNKNITINSKLANKNI